MGERTVGAIGRKSAALIAYLALSETGEETRERLVGLLWSETEEDKARASFVSLCTKSVKPSMREGFEGFRTDKVAIGLDRSRTDVDLRDIFDEAAAGRPHPLLLETERPNDRVLKSWTHSTLPSGSGWLPSASRSATG